MPTNKTPEDYLKFVPKPALEHLNTLRRIVKETAPEAEESTGYGILSYRLGGSPKLYLAGYAKHVAIYPLPKPAPEELKPYIFGKGTARFALDKPLPLSLIKGTIAQLLT